MASFPIVDREPARRSFSFVSLLLGLWFVALAFPTGWDGPVRLLFLVAFAVVFGWFLCSHARGLFGACVDVDPRRRRGSQVRGHVAGWGAVGDGRQAFFVLTDRQRAVLVTTIEQVVLASRADPDAFLAALERRRGPVSEAS